MRPSVCVLLIALGAARAIAAPIDPPSELEAPAAPTPTAPTPQHHAAKPKHHHRRPHPPGVPAAHGVPSNADQPPPQQPPTVEQDTSPEATGDTSADAAAVDAAPETGETNEPKKVVFEFHGFVMARATMADQDPHAPFYGIIPSLDGPRAYFEVDLQPRLKVYDQRLQISADVTAYLSTSAPKYLLLFNEMVVQSKIVGPLFLVAGRKRVIWGSGLAANPTDLINPVKNPLDFEQQRAGAFILPLVEVVTKKVTFSALLNPHTTYDQYALPTKLDFKKPLVAARIYTLLLGTDINFIYIYNHEVRHHYGGLSLSRYFVDKLEAHVETLIGQGPSGLPNVPIVPTCGVINPASKKVSASLIAGGRLDLSDQTFLSLEYLFNGNGFSNSAYDAYRADAACTRTALATFPQPAQGQPGHPVDPLFTLLREHYLALSFVRPHMTSQKLENLSLSATILWSVADLSLVLEARAAYKLYDAVSLGIMGVAFTGPAHGEFRSMPTRGAGMVDLRTSF